MNFDTLDNNHSIISSNDEHISNSKFVNQFGQPNRAVFADVKEESNYERILAKHRPNTPPSNGYAYTAYLQNIAHSVSRFMRGDKAILVAEDTAWKNGADARRIYNDKIEINPIIQTKLCKPMQMKGEKLDYLKRAIIRVFKDDA